MPGKQAKTLTTTQLKQALSAARQTRYPTRDRTILLLSVKAGLRAAEIAGLTWSMILDASGRLNDEIALSDHIAKRGSGRMIPIHFDLRTVLIKLRRQSGSEGHVIKSERGERLSAGSIVNWFRAHYESVGLIGCSSHSGRRTFITLAARRVSRAGGSLRDVSQLAGHRSVSMTQRYIDACPIAQRRLVRLL